MYSRSCLVEGLRRRKQVDQRERERSNVKTVNRYSFYIAMFSDWSIDLRRDNPRDTYENASNFSAFDLKTYVHKINL